MEFFNELQQDALTEVINMGMGKAAASLSEMINEEVLLSVPSLSFLNKNEAIEYLSNKCDSLLSGISQTFEGPVSGDALLLFPENRSMELVKLFLRDTVPMEYMHEMAQDALCEIGNIIINAGLSSMAEFLNSEINGSLPNFLSGTSEEVVQIHANSGDEFTALMIRVDFRIQNHEIDGYVMYMLSVESFGSFARATDALLANLSG